MTYSSYKSKRVVRSVLGGELYSLADGVDYALAIRSDLQQIVDQHLPVKIFTDSKSLFDSITKNAVMTEKRLMVDVQSLRESYISHEVSDIGWIRSEFNPADA